MQASQIGQTKFSLGRQFNGHKQQAVNIVLQLFCQSSAYQRANMRRYSMYLFSLQINAK